MHSPSKFKKEGFFFFFNVLGLKYVTVVLNVT